MFKLWHRPKIRNEPKCDRCGDPTGKPFLYDTPKTPWCCDPCEQKVTAILLGDAHERMVHGLDNILDVEAGLADLFRKLGPPPAGK
ncbi:hypothetical protein DT019_02750 [Streptomyces sp. SDr-06]|uniref:hypothetical protein n=1 Tax=Streptomyces sp. SDr-06 TaxID=2267702 RepID=UPI000DEB41AD|nr:hypothetical protein [Streptomyces sp. SDr-06]RCH70422.1 hypothetical protein DT019_02750 [Streptomyces sp. SDr-06]